MVEFPLKENQTAKEMLAAFLKKSGQFPNALFLHGPEGVGKKTTARYLAAALLCTEENAPCGVCSNCTRVFKDIHQDVTILRGEERQIKVDEVKELVNDASVLPGEAERRVFILGDMQNLSPTSQNALLKTLEDPPSYAYFILTATSPEVLLPTITSRLVGVEIRPVSDDTCTGVLHSLYPDAPQETLSLAVSCCNGSIGRGMRMISDDGFTDMAHRTLAVAAALNDSNMGSLLLALGNITGKKKDKERDELAKFSANLSILLLRGLHGDRRFFKKLSPQCLVALLDCMSSFDRLLAQNINTSTVVIWLHGQMEGCVGNR